MDIQSDASVKDAMSRNRRRRHREDIFYRVEEEIMKYKEKAGRDDDMGLWKQEEDIYKSKFCSKSTWKQLRTRREICEWSKGVWFSYATLKFAFLLGWLYIIDWQQEKGC